MNLSLCAKDDFLVDIKKAFLDHEEFTGLQIWHGETELQQPGYLSFEKNGLSYLA